MMKKKEEETWMTGTVSSLQTEEWIEEVAGFMTYLRFIASFSGIFLALTNRIINCMRVYISFNQQPTRA